jgi:hypothetical protein
VTGFLRAWFEGRLRREPDGTTLARPYGPFGGVYALDPAMRASYLRVRSRASAAGLAAAALGALLVIPFIGWFPYLLAALVLLANAHYFLVWRALRKARKVPRQRWSEAPVPDAEGSIPRWLCHILMVGSGLLAGLGVLAIATEGPSAPILLGVAFFALCTSFYAWLARRSR